MLVIKVLKNRQNQYGIWWGVCNDENEKVTKLAYKRFFKDVETANRWALKFKNKFV